MEDFEGGVKLTYVVTERPFVRDVLFSGNKKQDSSTLLEKIDLKLGTVYNPVEVNRAADKLKDFYETEGYFEVGITPEVEKLADGDVTVTFKIAEGRRITIEQIVDRGDAGPHPQAGPGRDGHPGAGVLHPAGDRPAAAAGRGHRPHRPALQRSRLRAGAGREVGDRRGPGEGPGHHPHRGGGGPPVQGRRGGRDRQLAPAPGGDPEAYPAQVGGRLLAEQAPGQRHRRHRPLQRDRTRLRRREPEHDAGHPQPARQRGVRGRGGPRDLRGAHQHLGQHPQRGEDPAPRDPDGGGRPLHEPEARPGQAAADQPQLLRQGRGQDRARARPRTRSSSTST